jgi:hypothetical protein
VVYDTDVGGLWNMRKKGWAAAEENCLVSWSCDGVWRAYAVEFCIYYRKFTRWAFYGIGSACVFVCVLTRSEKKVAALNGGCFAYAIYAFIPSSYSLLLLLADAKPRFWNSSS